MFLEFQRRFPAKWRDLLGVESAKEMLAVSAKHLGDGSQDGRPDDLRVLELLSDTAKILLTGGLLGGY